MRIIIEDITEEQEEAILKILTQKEQKVIQAVALHGPESMPKHKSYDIDSQEGKINTMNLLLGSLTYPISISESGSPSKKKVTCAKTAWNVLMTYDHEVFTETFEVVMKAWPDDKYRFDHWVIKDVAAFIGKYWGEYDRDILISHIARKSGKGCFPISAREFADMAKEKKGDGSTTSYLYHLCLRHRLEEVQA